MQETSESAATHRYKVVSLFSGGGGLDLGFKQAGYDIVWAIDNASDAVETYRKNIGDHIVCADINTISPDGIPQCDIIIGGPPCQSFSLAGNRNAEDARGQLVWTYLEIINAKRPKLFLFENVPGITSKKIDKSSEKLVITLLKEELREAGYGNFVEVILDAASFGVPQHRRRFFILAAKDGTWELTVPQEETDRHTVTVQEAAVMLNNVLGATDVPTAAFEGIVPAWASQATANLTACGVLVGAMRYDAALTRADAAQMLTAALAVRDGRE